MNILTVVGDARLRDFILTHSETAVKVNKAQVFFFAYQIDIFGFINIFYHRFIVEQ